MGGVEMDNVDNVRDARAIGRANGILPVEISRGESQSMDCWVKATHMQRGWLGVRAGKQVLGDGNSLPKGRGPPAPRVEMYWTTRRATGECNAAQADVFHHQRMIGEIEELREELRTLRMEIEQLAAAGQRAPLMIQQLDVPTQLVPQPNVMAPVPSSRQPTPNQDSAQAQAEALLLNYWKEEWDRRRCLKRVPAGLPWPTTRDVEPDGPDGIFELRGSTAVAGAMNRMDRAGSLVCLEELATGCTGERKQCGREKWVEVDASITDDRWASRKDILRLDGPSRRACEDKMRQVSPSRRARVDDKVWHLRTSARIGWTTYDGSGMELELERMWPVNETQQMSAFTSVDTLSVGWDNCPLRRTFVFRDIRHWGLREWGVSDDKDNARGTDVRVDKKMAGQPKIDGNHESFAIGGGRPTDCGSRCGNESGRRRGRIAKQEWLRGQRLSGRQDAYGTAENAEARLVVGMPRDGDGIGHANNKVSLISEKEATRTHSGVSFGERKCLLGHRATCLSHVCGAHMITERSTGTNVSQLVEGTEEADGNNFRCAAIDPHLRAKRIRRCPRVARPVDDQCSGGPPALVPWIKESVENHRRTYRVGGCGNVEREDG
ncbi:hypothetical protein GGX14DRAFT_407028 [Mycena pura]|uniref:Uncharacterized protein n=1 Tax=Mycena pura TaxID=153505 RepID=A0AAD6Y2Q3_9AGAR|nr:hypothetical protein GGX14DRAFT_407027 [Mycena pura]KAJ7191648.1 hypothetical protein GGX14DRAFT_407028 [Mycena pura]